MKRTRVTPENILLPHPDSWRFFSKERLKEQDLNDFLVGTLPGNTLEDMLLELPFFSERDDTWKRTTRIFLQKMNLSLFIPMQKNYDTPVPVEVVLPNIAGSAYTYWGCKSVILTLPPELIWKSYRR